MKKIFLALIIIAVSATANAQYFVTNKVLSDTLSSHSKTLVQKVNDQLMRVDREMSQYKFRQEESMDTIYNENLIDAWIDHLVTGYNSLVNQFAVMDTIAVDKIGEHFYLVGDSISIATHKLILKDRYDRLVAKWGRSKVDESTKGKAIRDEFFLWQKYENQLAAQ